MVLAVGEVDLKEIMVDQLLDLQEVWQVVAVELVVLVNLVEQEQLVNKMVDQEQILVQRFQEYLTLVFMLEVVAVDQDVVNLKEVLVDLVEVVTEKEELTKQLDQMQLLIQAVAVVELVEILVPTDVAFKVVQELLS